MVFKLFLYRVTCTVQAKKFVICRFQLHTASSENLTERRYKDRVYQENKQRLHREIRAQSFAQSLDLTCRNRAGTIG